MSKLLAKIAVALQMLFMPVAALAAPVVEGGLGGAQNALTVVGNKAGASQQPLPELIGNIINVALGLLGIIFVVLIVLAGFLYLTSAGEPAKVDKAKKIFTTSIIGLIIIVAAYAISSYVIAALITATGA